MKQSILWLAIGLITMAMTSCESKQEIFDQMEQEVTAMRQNVDTYTYDQWESAHERMNDLYEKLKDGDELTSEEQQRLDHIVNEAEKYLRAAQNVQLMRDLWEELKSTVMTCTKEEAADYLLRWLDACKEAKECEFSPKQKKEVSDLCRKIDELGNAPIRTDF